MSDLVLRPIGFLKSCYPEKFGVPRQPGLAPNSWAELRIEGHWQPELALQGLEDFSHVWLIFGFHRNTNEVYRPKVHPPRLKGESLGVFATRSPHRPNPLGLSLVKLEKIETPVLYLSGVDLVEGTPIYDVKPYLPQVESQPEARQGWTGAADSELAVVEWSPEALDELALWEKQRGPGADLKKLIEETLALDPRPVVYRGFEGETESKYRQVHAVRIETGDVHFQFLEPKKVLVTKLIAHYSANA